VTGAGVRTLVAVRGRATVGFARLSPARPIASPPPGCAEVTHLYVVAAERGRGTGRLLLERAVAVARAAGYGVLAVWTLEENRRARRFYERFGLVGDGARRTDPELFGNDAAEVRYRMELGRTGGESGRRKERGP
jgi:GNAT superfamily N-acetyltransferase